MSFSFVGDNYRQIAERVAAACERAGRVPDSVTIVAVSKTFPAEALSAAIAAGATDLGENRVQEFRDKRDAIDGSARFHLIGHLQSNKARDAVRLFDVVQTVDSLSLAKKLSESAVLAERTIAISLQVNIGREPQKNGLNEDQILELAAEVTSLPGVRLEGLMTIPPLGEDAITRGYFEAMRNASEALQTVVPEARGLSMGMSEDFEIAIEEGATSIRLGRAIFGKRDY